MTWTKRAVFPALAAFALACSSSSSPSTPAPNVDAGPSNLTYDFSALRNAMFGGTFKTDGVVVQHEGRIVFEQYANGYTADKRHITYSVSKSIGGTLVGIAVGEGLMKRADSICTYVPAPEGADPTFCETTIDDLLHMSSGLAWNESYDDPATSSVLPMLYGDEADMVVFAAKQKRDAKAGTRWQYSSGDSNLLAGALRKALGGKDVRAWAKEKLFDPAGMSSVVFESDRAGNLVFSSSCFLTPRDLAKLAQVYLDRGIASGKQVVPADWITYALTPAPAAATPTPRTGPNQGGGSYGGQVWLNAAKPDAPAETWAYPKMPVDTYSFEGHWGQKAFIVPSRKLVVVRVGNDRAPEFDSNQLVEPAVAAVDAAITAANVNGGTR